MGAGSQVQVLEEQHAFNPRATSLAPRLLVFNFWTQGILLPQLPKFLELQAYVCLVYTSTRIIYYFVLCEHVCVCVYKTGFHYAILAGPELTS